ncbi:unnamed protein product [Leuciscus chuanchicus]
MCQLINQGVAPIRLQEPIRSSSWIKTNTSHNSIKTQTDQKGRNNRCPLKHARCVCLPRPAPGSHPQCEEPRGEEAALGHGVGASECPCRPLPSYSMLKILQPA